jgi:hypothetical protein
LIRIPPYDVAVIDPKTGRMTQAWYDALKAIERIKTTDLADVAPTVPANLDVLIWNSTTSKFEPGLN